MLFVFLLDANLEESNECWNNQQVLADVVDGMGNVMNDKHLEATVMRQQMSVENVVPLVASEIVEEEEV
jgi:hypothetical protein